MFHRALPLALLPLCVTAFASEVEVEYVLGVDDDGYEIMGGAHSVVDFGTRRDAIDSYNEADRIHPELQGEAEVFDATLTTGESDHDVFASSWWPQSKNGVAQRWNGGEQDFSTHTDVDHLGPIEKYDALWNPGQTQTVDGVEHWNYSELNTPVSDRGPQHDHAAVTAIGPATAWELENHGVYQDGYHPDSWWGHCNGWASYVTTEADGAPQRDVRVKLVGNDIVECTSGEQGCVLFRMGDIEALMSELYFHDTATFGGQRCDTRPDDIERDEYGRPTDPACRDINPGTFHITITHLLGTGAEHLASGVVGNPAFIIDHNWDYQVWNFPVVDFEITETEDLTEAAATALVGGTGDYLWNTSATRFVRVALTYSMVSDSVGSQAMLQRADQRNIPLHPVDLHYVLELDSNDVILGGEWIEEPGTSWGDDSRELHPDFIWMGVDPKGSSEYSDDTGGSRDNPYLSYPHVKQLLNCANDPSTCDGSEDPDDDPSDPNDDTGSSGSGGSIDCGSCAGSHFEGPGPFMMTALWGLGFLLRRRERLTGLLK